MRRACAGRKHKRSCSWSFCVPWRGRPHVKIMKQVGTRTPKAEVIEPQGVDRSRYQLREVFDGCLTMSCGWRALVAPIGTAVASNASLRASGIRIDLSRQANTQASRQTSRAGAPVNRTSKRAIRKCAFRKDLHKLKNVHNDLVSKRPARKRANAMRKEAARRCRLHHLVDWARQQKNVEKLGPSSHETEPP